MYCRKCGNLIENTAAFCRYCGQPVNPNIIPGPGVWQPAMYGKPARSWTWLKITLTVLLLALIGVGVWKIPGNIKAVLSDPAMEEAADFGPRNEDAVQTPGRITGRQWNEYRAIDETAGQTQAEREAPEPHAVYEWFAGDPAGWEGLPEEEAP